MPGIVPVKSLGADSAPYSAGPALLREDGSLINIYGMTLWSGDDKYRQNVASPTAIFESDHSVRLVNFLVFYGV